MTKLDDAIKLCTEDVKTQSQFYDLFLNSVFYVPVVEEKNPTAPEDGAVPLLVEANDKIYLMLFDTISRLTDWANDKAKYLCCGSAVRADYGICSSGSSVGISGWRVF